MREEVILKKWSSGCGWDVGDVVRRIGDYPECRLTFSITEKECSLCNRKILPREKFVFNVERWGPMYPTWHDARYCLECVEIKTPKRVEQAVKDEKKCPAWGDMCDAEGCNGTKEEYWPNRHACYDMVSCYGVEERQEWIEYCRQKTPNPAAGKSREVR